MSKEEHYNQGLMLYSQGNHADAIEEYRKALEFVPDDAEIHMALSMAHQQLNQLDQAVEAAKKAVELDPKEPLMYTNLSRVYVKMGMIPAAEEAMAMANQLAAGF